MLILSQNMRGCNSQERKKLNDRDILSYLRTLVNDGTDSQTIGNAATTLLLFQDYLENKGAKDNETF